VPDECNALEAAAATWPQRPRDTSDRRRSVAAVATLATVLATVESDDIAWFAIVITALAACVTVWFAGQTVSEARALRREGRLDRIAELAAVGMRTMGDTLDQAKASRAVAQLRLMGALVGYEGELPEGGAPRQPARPRCRRHHRPSAGCRHRAR
jgi:hypothetical protein